MPKIIGTRRASPDKSGYPDAVMLEDTSNGMALWSRDRFGTNPNPTKPGTTLRWTAEYSQIVAQEYEYTVIITDGKPYLHLRLSFQGGEKIPTTNMNFNHDGEFYATAVNIEKGYSPTWRGSRACQELHPDDWDEFISHFKLGEKGVYLLVDETNV